MQLFFQKLQNWVLTSYVDSNWEKYLKATLALRASIFILIIQSFLFLVHLYFNENLSHLIIDAFTFCLFASTIPLLKAQKLTAFSIAYSVGVILMILVLVLYADIFENTKADTHPFHIFQTTALLLMAIGYFGFLFEKANKIFYFAIPGVILLITHSVILNNIFNNESFIFLLIVSIAEFIIGIIGIYLAINFYENLTNRLQNNNELIKSQKNELLNNENKLLLANKDLQEFAYAISHDLRQPMRSMAAFSGLLQRDLKRGNYSTEKLLEYTDEIIAGNKRMNKMISTVLDFANLDVSEENIENIDLNLTIDAVLKNLKQQITESNAIVKAEKLPQIKGSNDLMIRLFQNIISNAIKYKCETRDPEIKISYTKSFNSLQIHIKDNGSGIEEKHLKKIFHIFSRGDKPKVEGSGIGLSVCKRIAELHKGAIKVNSEVGKGSTFTLELPIE